MYRDVDRRQLAIWHGECAIQPKHLLLHATASTGVYQPGSLGLLVLLYIHLIPVYILTDYCACCCMQSVSPHLLLPQSLNSHTSSRLMFWVSRRVAVSIPIRRYDNVKIMSGAVRRQQQLGRYLYAIYIPTGVIVWCLLDGTTGSYANRTRRCAGGQPPLHSGHDTNRISVREESILMP